jgi:UDP-N-acetylmuramate dehydrogenase
MELSDKLKELNFGNVIPKPLMSRYTTYRVGGEALAIVSPYNTEELVKLIKYLKDNKINFKILGNGSNLVFPSKGYNGVLIKLDYFDTFYLKNDELKVGAGYSLMRAAMKCSRLGLSGLEFASGIPGSVGGAIFMNAGAYKSDMSQVVKSVTVLTPRYNVKTMSLKSLQFGYRDSYFHHHNGYVILQANIKLTKGNADEIMNIIQDRKIRRMASQPLEYPSAGSVFRNPEGMFAGALIEELGLKGYKIGDAEVSEKHANFIINKGNATGDDIQELIYYVQKEVKDKKKVELKIEQEIVR